jgi:hypothetical protein
MDTPAALPIAVGNVLPMKFVKDRYKPGRDRIFGA